MVESAQEHQVAGEADGPAEGFVTVSLEVEGDRSFEVLANHLRNLTECRRVRLVPCEETG